MSALVEAPLDPQTYRHLTFLLLSVPLGLAYSLFLATGFGLVPGALSGFAARLLDEPSPQVARLTAPASGLFLERVFYPGEPRDVAVRAAVRVGRP